MDDHTRSMLNRTQSFFSVGPSPEGNMEGKQSDLSAMNQTMISEIHVKEQMNRTFVKFNELKRRNPNKYLKNPTKVHFTSLGSKDYAFHDQAKLKEIKEYKNEDDKVRNDYIKKVPHGPKMGTEKSISPKPRVMLTAEESLLALGITANSPNLLGHQTSKLSFTELKSPEYKDQL